MLVALIMTVPSTITSQQQLYDLAGADVHSCDEVQAFAEMVLDSSLFFNTEVSTITDSILNHTDLIRCDAYPMILSIRGFLDYIQQEIIVSRTRLLRADSLMMSLRKMEDRYKIRNKIFLGLNYMTDGDSTMTLPFLRAARDMARENENDRLLADAVLNMSVVYLRINDLELGKKHLDEALSYANRSQSHQIRAFCHLNLSDYYRRIDQTSAALRELNLADSIFVDLLDHNQHYFSCASRGFIFLDLADEENAKLSFLKALEYGDKIGQKTMHGPCYFQLGFLYQDLDVTQSTDFFEKAFEYSSTLAEKNYVMLIEELMSEYRKTEDFEKLAALYSGILKHTMDYRTKSKIEFEKTNDREIAIQQVKFQNTLLEKRNKENLKLGYTIISAIILCTLLALFAYIQLKGSDVIEL